MAFPFFDLPLEVRDQIFRYLGFRYTGQSLPHPDFYDDKEVEYAKLGLVELKWEGNSKDYTLAVQHEPIAQAVRDYGNTLCSAKLFCRAMYREICETIARQQKAREITWTMDCIVLAGLWGGQPTIQFAFTDIPFSLRPKPYRIVVNMRFLQDEEGLDEDLEDDDPLSSELAHQQSDFCTAFKDFVEGLRLNMLLQKSFLLKIKFLHDWIPDYQQYGRLSFALTTGPENENDSLSDDQSDNGEAIRSTAESEQSRTDSRGSIDDEVQEDEQEMDTAMTQDQVDDDDSMSEPQQDPAVEIQASDDESETDPYPLVPMNPLFVGRKIYHLCQDKFGDNVPTFIINGSPIEILNGDCGDDWDDNRNSCDFPCYWGPQFQLPDGTPDDHVVTSCQMIFEGLHDWYERAAEVARAHVLESSYRGQRQECLIM